MTVRGDTRYHETVVSTLKRRMGLFGFRWARDSAGYFVTGRVLRRRGGAMEAYSPEHVHPPIHHQFADLLPNPELGYVGMDNVIAKDWRHGRHARSHHERTIDETVRQFTDQFGLLGWVDGGADAKEQPLDYFIAEQRRLAGFVDFVLETRATKRTPKRFPVDVFNQAYPPHMTIQLEPLYGVGYRINVVPRSLISYMWFRVAQEIAAGSEWRACKECGYSFEIREDDKRQRDKIFCSTKCRVKSHRREAIGKGARNA